MTDAAARLLKGQEALITGPGSGSARLSAASTSSPQAQACKKDSAIANMTLNESQAVLAINLTGQFLLQRRL
jgi:hypothetical protein